MGWEEPGRYAPASWRDARSSRGFGREHLRSSTRLICSRVTIGRWGVTSLWRVLAEGPFSGESAALTNPQDNLRRPIMPRTNNTRMILIIERRTPKINQVDLRTQQNPPKLRAPRSQRAARWDIPVISKRLVRMTQEQDVLGFEIGMDEVEVVQEGDGAEELAGEGLDVRAWEGYEARRFEEVEDAEAEEGRHDADVASPVEAVAELDAAVAVVSVGVFECLQDAELDATSISILSNGQYSFSLGRKERTLTFGTARIILTATSLRVRISRALTTLPKVP